ncbi:hypothetical protein V6N12_007035 [Hibiscus sabdariffa]|uniref:Uncharacterized protein n=1 Tax=Hibiscus sabdariffa TaxID=183260 RepID=A0ABR2F0J9_9ROSI
MHNMQPKENKSYVGPNLPHAPKTDNTDQQKYVHNEQKGRSEGDIKHQTKDRSSNDRSLKAWISKMKNDQRRRKRNHKPPMALPSTMGAKP